MATRHGVDHFLSCNERHKLQTEYDKTLSMLFPAVGGLAGREYVAAVAAPQDEPCRLCGKDSDHANLLICDKCEGHFHTYCLDPPLKEIPEDDWFCAVCKPDVGDGLEELVSALPPHIKSRFGEICWAQGGVGYGWWPCCIYDPRLTMGVTRTQARKQVGKKFLVYFLQCDETPFDLLTEKKIVSWEQGLAEDYHLGRTAKAAGKQRYVRFLEAMQAACIEESKPVEFRLEFNRAIPGQPSVLPSPVKIAQVRSSTQHGGRGHGSQQHQTNKKKRGRRSSHSEEDQQLARAIKLSRQEQETGGGHHPIRALTRQDSVSSSSSRSLASSSQHHHHHHHAGESHKKRLEELALSAEPSESKDEDEEEDERQQQHNSTSRPTSTTKGRQQHGTTPNDESSGDGELYCRVFRVTENDEKEGGVCVGFAELPSRAKSTFADARAIIEDIIEPQYLFEDWRFLHPKLGPVSLRLEQKTGPMLAYLNKGSKGADIAEGTIDAPVKVTIIAAPDPLSHKSKTHK